MTFLIKKEAVLLRFTHCTSLITINLMSLYASLSELHLQKNNTDADLAPRWPSWNNDALVKHNIYQCFVWACSSSQKPWVEWSLTIFAIWDLELHLYLCFGQLPTWPIFTAEARRRQRSSTDRGSLTQLGPGNSSFTNNSST